MLEKHSQEENKYTIGWACEAWHKELYKPSQRERIRFMRRKVLSLFSVEKKEMTISRFRVFPC